MARNATISGAYPEFYQAAERPVEGVTFEELKGVSEPFGGFVTKVGDVWKFGTLDFYKNDPEKKNTKRQRVQRKLRTGEEPKYSYSVIAERTRDGVTTNEWFSLNYLAKTDADRKAVNPSWHALGGADKRLEELCRMGTIKVIGEGKIQAAVFQGGRPNRVPTLDPNTREQMIDEFGTGMTHVETHPQDVYYLTPVGAKIEEAPAEAPKA